MQAIIITGIAVFIGSNFIPYFLKEKIEYNDVNLDLLKFAGDLQNLKELVIFQLKRVVKSYLTKLLYIIFYL
jgi:dTDP-glucose 4,6-dehydratase